MNNAFDEISDSAFDFYFPENKFREIEWLQKEFDFNLDAGHFIEWLRAEGETITGDYAQDVNSMCEYACLYISMLFCDKKLKGDMVVYYGKFGTTFEHYWVGYKIDGREYFIDLTLQQFDPKAPKIACCEAHNERCGHSYSSLSEGTPIQEYTGNKRAFRFYTNPITMITPPDAKLFNNVVSFPNLMEQAMDFVS